MKPLVSAYNGEAQTFQNIREVGNTVGSLSVEERDVVIGCLLGDGAMRCKTNALFEINHSIKQRDYVDWKFQKLQRLVITPPKPRCGNGNRVAYRFTTRSVSILTELYRWFYPNGTKQIPNDLELSPLSLAVWIMDDGSKSYCAMYLNTQQFLKEEQELLIRKLDEQFNIQSALNRDKQYTRIRIKVESVKRLHAIVNPHLLASFDYKFPL